MKRHGIKVYPATNQCRKCKGACCQSMPGIYHPKDIKGPKRAAIAKMLRERRAAIDCYDDSSPIYYLRPVAGGSEKVFDFSWGGCCQHLTAKGCALPEDKRPLGCLTVEPKANTTDSCHNHQDKYESARWWTDYQDMLQEVGRSIDN